MNIKLRNKIQKDTLKEIDSIISESKRCAIIRPTGFGKTFMLMQLICKEFKNKNILYVFPQKILAKDIQEKYDKELSKANVKFISYQKLAKKSKYTEKMIRSEFGEIDVVLFDEMHKMGGNLTEKGISKLIHAYKDIIVIGATATPHRADGKDVVEKFFKGCQTSKYTLENALKDDIIQKPHYVYCAYDTDGIKDHVSNMIKEKITKHNISISNDELNAKLSAFELEMSEINAIDKIIKKHIDSQIKDTNYMKFITFSSTMKSAELNQSKVISWFKKAYPTHHIRSTIIVSSSKYRKNVDKLLKLNHTKHTIDLIFCVDMLNMGYHIDDLTGIIMMRGTNSDTIYNQQMGRCLSVATDNRTIVFDLVNNLFRKSYFKAVGEETEINDEVETIYKGKSWESRYLYAEDYVAKTDEIIRRFIYSLMSSLEKDIIYWYTEKSMPKKKVAQVLHTSVKKVEEVLTANNIEIED